MTPSTPWSRGDAEREAKGSRGGTVLGIHPCDAGNQVVTVQAERNAFRREVCAECPWRRDAEPGAFPAEAFRHSASTCADMAPTTFACHMSGTERPATCAGFLLSRHAPHNLSVRLRAMKGEPLLQDVRATAPTYDDYREMAVANGMDAEDPALAVVRGAR